MGGCTAQVGRRRTARRPKTEMCSTSFPAMIRMPLASSCHRVWFVDWSVRHPLSGDGACQNEQASASRPMLHSTRRCHVAAPTSLFVTLIARRVFSRPITFSNRAHKRNFAMRCVNLDQLRRLATVARLGSLPAAARRLRLTQSAVSLQIRELEKCVDASAVTEACGLPTQGRRDRCSSAPSAR